MDSTAHDQFASVMGTRRGGHQPPYVAPVVFAADHPYLLDGPGLWLPAKDGQEYRRSPAVGVEVGIDGDSQDPDVLALLEDGAEPQDLKATVEFVREPQLLRQPDGSAIVATPADAPVDLLIDGKSWVLLARHLLLTPMEAGPRYLQPELPDLLPESSLVCLLPDDLMTRRMEPSWAVAPVGVHTPPLAHRTHLITCEEREGVHAACLPDEPITIGHDRASAGMTPGELHDITLGLLDLKQSSPQKAPAELQEPGVVSVQALGFELVRITGEPGGILPTWL